MYLFRFHFRATRHILQFLPKSSIRLDFDLAAQYTLKVTILELVICKEYSRVLGDDSIGEEDGIVVNVRAAKVEEPGNFIECGQHKYRTLLFGHLFSQSLEFGGVRFTCM
jgi:hypothetical protein